MANIRPFNAVRPPADKASAVASVPYDVVNTGEAKALAEGNPLSFLHVSRPEIDLPEGTDIYSDAVYRKAVENYEKLKRECPLQTEEAPSIYLYRQIMGDKANASWALLEIGRTYEEAGKKDDAIKTFKLVCDRFPKSGEGSWAHAHLNDKYKISVTLGGAKD